MKYISALLLIFSTFAFAPNFASVSFASDLSSVAFALGFSSVAFATSIDESEPVLTIHSSKMTKKFTRGELLSAPYVKKIVVMKDPAYHEKTRTYRAVPLAKLFEAFNREDIKSITFACLDGFSAPLNVEHALNTDPNQSIAYVAVESPHEPWPRLKKKDSKSAGPFYLVWENPDKSKISVEEWPFQLVGLEIKASIGEQFPLIVPEASVKEGQPIAKGFQAFLKNCFACHSMNGQGLAHMGPDLNLPYNPTEYLVPKYFEILVRKPSNLRSWPDSKMSPISKESLSDEDLANLVEYLKYMAKRKAK